MKRSLIGRPKCCRQNCSKSAGAGAGGSSLFAFQASTKPSKHS
jgi:hypothetical protein